MSTLNISAISCVKRTYEFNDGSIVQWTPDDDSQKAHGMFTVRICLKSDGRVRVICWHREGPPSEAASLHWLKCAKKDQKKE
jgi:hypothetical protein